MGVDATMNCHLRKAKVTVYVMACSLPVVYSIACVTHPWWLMQFGLCCACLSLVYIYTLTPPLSKLTCFHRLTYACIHLTKTRQIPEIIFHSERSWQYNAGLVAPGILEPRRSLGGYRCRSSPQGRHSPTATTTNGSERWGRRRAWSWEEMSGRMKALLRTILARAFSSMYDLKMCGIDA